MIKLLLSTAIYFSLTLANATEKVKSIEVLDKSEELTAEFSFKGKISQKDIVKSFVKRSSQFDIKGLQIPKTSKSIKVSNKEIKNLYLYNLDDSTLRLRFNSKEGLAETLKDRWEIATKKGKLTLRLAKKKMLLATAKLPSAKLIVGADGEIDSVQGTIDPATDLPEEEIPLVLAKVKKAETATKSNYYKVVISLSVVLLMVFGLFLFLKKWKKFSGVDKNTNSIKLYLLH